MFKKRMVHSQSLDGGLSLLKPKEIEHNEGSPQLEQQQDEQRLWLKQEDDSERTLMSSPSQLLKVTTLNP